LDLGEGRALDELAEVDAADVVDETELDRVEVEAGQVEAVEQTELLELEDHLQLLELEERLEVERVALEQALEGQDVEVVDGAKGLEQLEVERVDVEQVVQVLRLESAQVVELRQVEVGPLLSGGSSGEAGQGSNEDSGGLHFDWWCVVEKDS